MQVVVKTVKDLRDFCLENNYLFASYKKQDSRDWQKHCEEANYDDSIPDSLQIFCDEEGKSISYRETMSLDGQWVFRLHNNYNLPEIIPCIRI